MAPLRTVPVVPPRPRAPRPTPQAAAMYRAERWLLPGPAYPTLTTAQAYVDAVTGSAAWAAVTADGRPVTLKVTVKPAYGASTYRHKRLITVADRLLRTARLHQVLLLHELAHVASPVGGHGPVFRARYRWLLAGFASNPNVQPAAWFPAEQVARLEFGLALGGLRLATGGTAGVAGPGAPAVRWAVPAVPAGMAAAAALARAGGSDAAVWAALGAR